MSLLALNTTSIPLGQPLPFALRGADGVLLAQKGFVIQSRNELDSLIARGRQLCVDTEESGASHRAYLAQLHRMLNTDTALGEIAAMTMVKAAPSLTAAQDEKDKERERDRERKDPPAWHELPLRLTQLLRAPSEMDFEPRFTAFFNELERSCRLTPDATLLALIYLSAQDNRLYSATHAMLVSCVCMVVARETLRWPDEVARKVGCAGLSMNVAMTELQDQLAQQSQPLSAHQVVAVEDHAARSAALLQAMGIQDPAWLEAVRCHHQRAPGPLSRKTQAQQMARLIQRADIFGARLAPREARWPMLVNEAMQASYYDENHQVDEMGASLVKTLGVYPPGAFVRLASQEIGIVVRRGATATTPRVAVVKNREGMPTGEPIPRDTSQSHWKIKGVVPYKDMRVKWPLERLLSLV
jgi:HD-GYP domain-containing protein (c-di-GMP phosphodiesterase class II)